MITSVQVQPNIAGYQILEQLYAGSRTLVYRAIRVCDQTHVSLREQQPVVLKILRNEYPSCNELLQFRHQYIIAKNLNFPGIIQTYNLENHGNRYVLVTEDFGGMSLQQFIQKHPLDITTFLKIAIQLADILYELYQHRVIHKDIKPANILIHPETQQVKLIDFSISSLLPKETQEIQNPNILQGTLAYISPEQTGRMNRGIDYRTDFYSLGVTFYELLTGKLPFSSDDPMELLHCHIAKVPTFPHTPRSERSRTAHPIPLAMSEVELHTLVNIVMKLMAKNAEDRYQSAWGLKYDLERCLSDWKKTGKISEFVIAQQDRSDRFIIPEKLYGRETEVAELLAAFERVNQEEEETIATSELLLVAGFSGIGKTAVINEVHKPIVQQQGYFIKGKFDQFNRNIPFSAFVQAFRDLMGQLLSESDAQLSHWKTKIIEAVGVQGQVIVEVIPELEKIIGQQPPVTELSGSAAQNRFNLLFQKFIQVFTQKEHPLVIFLDDLQWADSASLNLLKLLITESELGYLLILGAYRDNEVFPAHPLMLTLDEIQTSQTTVNTITLAPLAEKTVNQLVADTLGCLEEFAQPLTELVYQKTQGNPFFTTQFLKALHQEGWIEFNQSLGFWQCDMASLRQLALTDDVVEFMATQLQKLPPQTQTVLKLAACIGAQFDLNTLTIVSEQSQTETATALWKALQEGLILPITETYKFFQTNETETALHDISVPYKFLHDRVQQAAYSIIPQGQKQATHLHIGRLLWQNLSQEEQETQIFTIVNHWNQAIELIEDTTEQNQLIQLNLTAGQKAKSSAAYEAALKYFQTALSLLNAETWQTNYPLALQLHEANAEAAYLTGHFELMETLIEQVLNHGKDLLDWVKVHEIKMQAQMAQTQQLSAVDTGIQILALLGIQVPESPQPEDLQTEIAAISQAMSGKAIADLADLPLMADRNQLAKVNLLASLLPACYQAKPNLFPWVVCKLMQLLIQYGNTPRSSHIYSCYGMVCIFALQDMISAAEYGKLACQLDLSPQTGNGVDGRYVTGACIIHCSTHVKEALPLLLKAYQAGLETGNFQFGGYAISNRSQYLYLVGHDLSSLKLEMAAASHALATMKQGNTLAWNQTFEQAVLNLLAESATPWQLVGTAYNETESLPFQIAANDRTVLHYVYLNKLILCYLFGKIPQAVENAALAESYLDGVIGFLNEYAFNFYDSLTQLADYTHKEISVQKSILEKVQAHQLKMQYWTTYAPMNGQHKYDLVAAEQCRILGNKLEAIDLYDRAITGAKEQGYIQEEALANELAAQFYLNWGKEKVAAGYLQEAYYCYARWGAKAKTDNLEKRYPHLLKPILQTAAQRFNLLETLGTIATPNLSIHASKATSHSSSTSINTALDFAAIIQASQALSGTLKLDHLLHQLTQIILQNSGGDYCALILPHHNSQWYVAAIATPENTELCSVFLAENSHLPLKLIQYVKNTQELIVIDDLKTDLPVIGEYLIQQQPKSVLCLPILNQGQLVGILYLQNQSTSRVFTEERILVLNFFCTQAAISLENARLYRQAQQALQDLQQAQMQIVQSEKMSALGNLVAGVAHEINNPVGFLKGNIQPALDYIHDLFGLIDLYQEKLPESDPDIEAEIEAIDLGFIREDLPQLIESMNVGVERIKNISKSLRTFSRGDSDRPVLFNLNEGLDSTFLILKHRFKASESRPEIKVIKNYGNIPKVECFAGQLNQVFMNILANGIDAIEQSCEGVDSETLKANPKQITITTELLEDQQQVVIRLRDNGTGMSEEVKEKIFDHLFTTKGVGKGTGLGLAISRQIVVEKHGGLLTVDSTLNQYTEFVIILPIQRAK